MNVEAFYASRQLERALKYFREGQLMAANDAVRRAKDAVDRIVERPEPEAQDEPHPESCLCRPCHETMLEKL